MTFSHCHLGWFFWGGLLNCFWGKKKHVHHQIWGDKYQNLPSVLWSFHGEILGSIPRLGPVAPLGGWSDDLWWRKWIHRDKLMGFFGISKNIWNSMTFVWVFKDDATLDVTALFGYIYIFFPGVFVKLKMADEKRLALPKAQVSDVRFDFWIEADKTYHRFMFL